MLSRIFGRGVKIWHFLTSERKPYAVQRSSSHKMDIKPCMSVKSMDLKVYIYSSSPDLQISSGNGTCRECYLRKRCTVEKCLDGCDVAYALSHTR